MDLLHPFNLWFKTFSNESFSCFKRFHAIIQSQASGFDEENLELIASQCYNWGLLGLSLGSADAGAMSERLVGTAQSFLPFCAGLQQHADSIAKVSNLNKGQS